MGLLLVGGALSGALVNWGCIGLISVPLLMTLFPPQKRQLAAQSLAYNLKDKVFCELFPEVVEVRQFIQSFGFLQLFSFSVNHQRSELFPKPPTPSPLVLGSISLWFSLSSPPQEIKQKQKAQEELNNRPPSLPLPDVVPDGEAHYGQNGIPLLNGHVPLAPANHPGLQQANRNHGLLGGALANLFVIVGFAAFAYTVKYVLRSIAQE